MSPKRLCLSAGSQHLPNPRSSQLRNRGLSRPPEGTSFLQPEVPPVAGALTQYRRARPTSQGPPFLRTEVQAAFGGDSVGPTVA